MAIQHAKPSAQLTLRDLLDAEARLYRWAGVLLKLFPELEPSEGIIESPLLSASNLQRATCGADRLWGQWLIKADHALPVVGSIKARGAIYEVLVHAEKLAREAGVLKFSDDYLQLTSTEARSLFARHRIAVGSTGNLGLSIGTVAAALNFQATIHMSANAKEWKKSRLRAQGVEVIEHEGDFGAAVAAGRTLTQQDRCAYFIDDEHSKHLFLGYGVAALRLQRQLVAHGVKVDKEHPLFVYLPCGVGGAPGGITFGLSHLIGNHAHCFFAEPLAAPSMLIRLASDGDEPIAVQDLGLDNSTEADGLAVGQASELAASMVESLVSGVFTVPDDDLFEDLFLLEQTEGLRIEPSAAAGFRGPRWLLESEAGRQYLADHDLLKSISNATHVLWTTGGALVPRAEYEQFHQRGRIIHECPGPSQTNI